MSSTLPSRGRGRKLYLSRHKEGGRGKKEKKGEAREKKAERVAYPLTRKAEDSLRGVLVEKRRRRLPGRGNEKATVPTHPNKEKGQANVHLLDLWKKERKKKKKGNQRTTEKEKKGRGSCFPEERGRKIRSLFSLFLQGEKKERGGGKKFKKKGAGL